MDTNIKMLGEDDKTRYSVLFLHSEFFTLGLRKCVFSTNPVLQALYIRHIVPGNNFWKLLSLQSALNRHETVQVWMGHSLDCGGKTVGPQRQKLLKEIIDNESLPLYLALRCSLVSLVRAVTMENSGNCKGQVSCCQSEVGKTIIFFTASNH